MPTGLDKIWSWFYLILILPAAIYYGTRVYDYFKHKNIQDNISDLHTETRNAFLKIEQREPCNKPPAILSIVLITCSFLMLAFGVWGVYLWVAGKVAVQIDMWTIFFLVLFLILPIWVFVDTFILQRKFYRLGKSMVAKEADVVYDGDANTAFNACQRVLDKMRASIIKMDKPKLLKARLRKSMITVTIRYRKGSKARINILSDSQWLTVKFDVGANQRNMDTFLKKLGSR